MAKKLPLFGREKFLREQAKEKERKENEKRKLKEKQKRQRRKAKEKVRKLKQKQKKQSKQRQKINDVRINPDTRDVKQLKDILRKMKKRIDSDIRKLLDEVRKTGNISPPALDDLLNTGGRISTKGDNYDDLYREYLRGKKFLEDDTHTLKGYRDFIKGIDDVMVDEFGDDWYDAGYNDSDNEFSK